MTHVATHTIVPTAPPALPIAPVAYEMRYVDQFNRILTQYFNTISGSINTLISPGGGDYLRPSFGSFYDTTTQSHTVSNTAKAVTFNTTALQYQTTTGTPTSEVTVASSGVYSVAFTAQIANSAAAQHSVWAWVRVNGTNYPNSGGLTTLNGVGSNAVISREVVLSLTGGDYIEIMWAVDDHTSITMPYTAASAPVPAIPSATLLVSRISGPLT